MSIRLGVVGSIRVFLQNLNPKNQHAGAPKQPPATAKTGDAFVPAGPTR